MPAISMMGVGSVTYRPVRDWGALPPGLDYGTISSVAVDSSDRVYVYHRGKPPVLVFDSDGQYLSGWGEKEIGDPHGMFISPDDHIFLVDRDGHRFHKFDTDGKVLLSVGDGRPTKGAPFNHPADIAVSPSGDIYIADGYGNSLVHRFSSEGKHLLSWGAPGRGSGELSVPHGIWVDDNRVYVADRDNHRIQVYSTDGAWITEWTDLYQPTDIFGDANGVLYITDLSTRVHMLDRDGSLLARGRSGNQGHGIWADSAGNLYVASTRASRVEKCVRQS